MRRGVFLWGLAACCSVLLMPQSAPAATTITPALQEMLSVLSAGGNKAQGDEIFSAIQASPRLIAQLDQLAISGQLKGFSFALNSLGRFGANQHNGVITFTPKFIDDQTPAGGGDEASRATFGQRDIVFILGYMTSKIQTSGDIALAESNNLATLKAETNATPKGGSVDVTQFVNAGIQAHLQAEAQAYLEGWNDEVDAAMTAKGGLLTPAEAFQLLKLSRNTRALYEAALLPQNERLTPIGTLQFMPDDHNREAVVSVLRHSNVPDFQ